MTAPVIREYLKVIGNETAGADDADLVARFAATRDEAAFELLVWRHAALVQRVCRAVLRDHHEAEDAAQATFLVLARKAASFGGRRSVVGWLYRVSRRLSVRLARQRARLPVGAAALDGVPAREAEDTADDSADVLCEEIDRLAEEYRIPVLLCFFEGLTHAEAAHRTGWPVGTVAGRLARAKDLLARRLSRRGVGLGAIALPVASATFVGSTARAATAFAAGTTGLVTPTVLSLAQGASTTVATTLLKLSAAAIAVLCAATAGVWGFAPPATTPPAGVGAPAPPPAAPMTLPGGGAGPVPANAEKPVVQDADAPQRARSVNNLKQIMLAFHSYHDQHKCFPRDITDNGGRLLLSWRVHLLPYLEQGALYKQFRLDESWDSENNKKLLAKMPAVFRTGTEPKDGTKTYYQGFVGPGTVFEPGERLTFTGITDGTSNTIGVIEAGPATEWTKPGGIPYDPKKPFPKLVGPFSNVRIVALMDGSVAAFKPDLKDDVLRKFVERADGEVVDHDAARANVKPAAKEGQQPRGNAQKEIADLADRMHALQAEQQKLLAEAAEKAKRAQENVEALTRENQVLKAENEVLKRQIEELKKLTPKK
jgi:RNA polymerase sigma factor (sigma-70 family)